MRGSVLSKSFLGRVEIVSEPLRVRPGWLEMKSPAAGVRAGLLFQSCALPTTRLQSRRPWASDSSANLLRLAPLALTLPKTQTTADTIENI